MLVIYILYKYERNGNEIMSVKMIKENVCINQIVGQKEDKIIVESDEIVPDIKPDVLKIIASNGNICIYKKEIQDGKIRFDGSIYVYTLYIADDETSSIHSINSSMDFSKIIDLDNIRANMQLNSSCELKTIDCKILNGRKVSLSAIANINVCVYSNENVDIIKDTEEINDLQKLEKDYKINSLVGSGITKTYAKDTVMIDASDNLTDIVKVKFDISNKEYKINYNKVLAKAEANIKIVYLTDDNRINATNANIPIMGFIDIENISEENSCEINYELKNISIKPNSIDEHSIYVEAEVEITATASESKDVKIIQDLYSPTIDVNYKQKTIKLMQNQNRINQVCNIRKQESIPEIGRNQIYDVDVKSNITNCQTLDGRISYDGELNLTFLYATQDSEKIVSKTLVESFNFNIADERINTNTEINTNIKVESQDFIVMPDESIDIKVDLNFEVSLLNSESINIINDIDTVENRNREKCSIAIYYTKKGDTLWDIAKRFGSTVDEIVRINKIEDQDLIMPGEQLFIPR